MTSPVYRTPFSMKHVFLLSVFAVVSAAAEVEIDDSVSLQGDPDCSYEDDALANAMKLNLLQAKASWTISANAKIESTDGQLPPFLQPFWLHDGSNRTSRALISAYVFADQQLLSVINNAHLPLHVDGEGMFDRMRALSRPCYGGSTATKSMTHTLACGANHRQVQMSFEKMATFNFNNMLAQLNSILGAITAWSGFGAALHMQMPLPAETAAAWLRGNVTEAMNAVRGVGVQFNNALAAQQLNLLSANMFAVARSVHALESAIQATSAHLTHALMNMSGALPAMRSNMNAMVPNLVQSQVMGIHSGFMEVASTIYSDANDLSLFLSSAVAPNANNGTVPTQSALASQDATVLSKSRVTQFNSSIGLLFQQGFAVFHNDTIDLESSVDRRRVELDQLIALDAHGTPTESRLTAFGTAMRNALNETHQGLNRTVASMNSMVDSINADLISNGIQFSSRWDVVQNPASWMLRNLTNALNIVTALSQREPEKAQTKSLAQLAQLNADLNGMIDSSLLFELNYRAGINRFVDTWTSALNTPTLAFDGRLPVFFENIPNRIHIALQAITLLAQPQVWGL